MTGEVVPVATREDPVLTPDMTENVYGEAEVMADGKALNGLMKRARNLLATFE
jgi:hypothetical protein